MTPASLRPTALALALAVLATPALADGDPAAGERAFRQCAACHQLAEGQHRVGPSLHGLFGREAGTADGFRYSPDVVAAGEAGLVWEHDTLLAYLDNPTEFLKEALDKPRVSTRMPNRYPDEQMRRDIIAYLEQELGG
jgi:cytochrome c